MWFYQITQQMSWKVFTPVKPILVTISVRITRVLFPWLSAECKHAFLTHSTCLMEGGRGAAGRGGVSPGCRLKMNSSPHILLEKGKSDMEVMHNCSSSCRWCHTSLPTGFSLVQVKWPHMIFGRKEAPFYYMPRVNSIFPTTVVLSMFSHALPKVIWREIVTCP